MASRCVDDVPWIDYSVVVNDPDGVVTASTARLVLSAGSHTVTVPLGTLTDGAVSGSVRWPGASVDAAGTATGWPGWEFSAGSWRETAGNYAWTRGAISATIEVNPAISLPLAYPPAASGCAPRAAQVTASAALARTGGEFALAAGVGIGALALVAAGATLVLRRRRA